MYDSNSPFTSKPAALQPQQKTEFAEERLTQAILWCEIAPGATATEVELAERFGLGRAATRAALARLSAFGLIQPIPRMGWRVLPMSGALIGNVISARRLNEVALAQTRLASDVMAKAANLASMISVADDRMDASLRPTRRGYERDFLEILASGVNPIIANFLKSLWDQSDRIVRFLEAAGAEPMGALNGESISDALREGRREAACEALIEHLDLFQDFASKGLLKNGSELAMKGGDVKARAAPKDKREDDVSADRPIRATSRATLSTNEPKPGS